MLHLTSACLSQVDSASDTYQALLGSPDQADHGKASSKNGSLPKVHSTAANNVPFNAPPMLLQPLRWGSAAGSQPQSTLRSSLLDSSL